MRDATRRLATMTMVCAALACCSRAGAQSPAGTRLPDTEGGKRVAAYLAAFNSGDDAAMLAFFADNTDPSAPAARTPEQRVAMTRQLRSDAGQLTLRRVERADAGEMVVLVEGSTGRVLRFRFRFTSEPPHYVAGIGVTMADRADLAEPPEAGSEADAVAAIRTHAAAEAAAGRFAGTVLVAHGDEILLHEAWGLASREHGVANRADTLYNLGSINKLFTRIAVLQLVEAGRLSLDAKLGEVLPGYPNAEAREKVTVRRLLDMTSGIGDFFGERFAATPKDAFRANGDFLPMFAADPLLFEPGSGQRYSNGGYAVLGEIIARVSGRSYYNYVHEHVFAPAGMSGAAWYEADAIVPNLAEGYTRDEKTGVLRRNIYSRPARGSAAGGGYATAGDLFRFARALLAGRLLSPVFTDWVLGGPEPAPGAAAPAAGGRGGLAVAGGAPGINAALELDPETGFTVVVLGNLDPPAATDVARYARRVLRGAAGQPAR